MYDSIFSIKQLTKAETYLKERKVKNIIFSSATYQVEVLDVGSMQWTFVQLDSEHHFSDLFCECGGTKSEPCVHLAASVKAIFRDQTLPLHVRYEKSLWKKLLEESADRLGYDQHVLTKEGDTYSFKKDGSAKFELTPKTDRAKEHMKITVDKREEETEETSIKFSNLEPDELESWKNGNPSKKLSFELSFWADLAKYLAFIEDEDTKTKIHLVEKKGSVPSGLQIEMDDFTIVMTVEKDRWEGLAAPLREYHTNLPVHEMSGRDIEKITYDKKQSAFLITGSISSAGSGEESVIDLGDWKFLPTKGFFPSSDDPLLSGDSIPEDKIEKVLDRYKDKFLTWLKGDTIHSDEAKVKFYLHFDEANNLHISMYIFEKEDLNDP